MRFIDKYFYMILFLFVIFLLFAVSFWNIFIVPLHSEVSANVSGLAAQEERILYSFFASDIDKNIENEEADVFKKQKMEEIKKTYRALLYEDKNLWLQSQSFCRIEYEFMENTEKQFLKTMFIWFVLFVLFLTLELANKVDLKNISSKVLLILITTVLLIYVDSANVDDNFFLLMKTAVFLTSFYFVYGLAGRFKTNAFFWIFIIIGIVFNPFVPVVSKILFLGNINLYSAAVFIIYFSFLCRQNLYSKLNKRI